MPSPHHKAKRKPNSWNGERFYTQLDMALIKHDQAILNSQRKRGAAPPAKNGFEYISVCGCGVEGCFIHGSVSAEDAVLINKEKKNR